MRTPFQRLCLLVAASSLYTFLVNGGVFTGSQLGDLAAGYGPIYFAMLWVSDDARRTKYWPAYHYGVFLVLFWFLAIPHYVLRTRGRRGLAFACGLLLLLSLPICAAFAGWWLYEELPDLRP